MPAPGHLIVSIDWMPSADDLALLVDALDREFYRHSAIRITPDSRVGSMTLRLLEHARVGRSVIDQYRAANALGVLRKDTERHEMSFVFVLDDGDYLRLIVRRGERRLRHYHVVAGALRNTNIRDHRQREHVYRYSAGVAALHRAQPIVHRFSANRVWDAVFQTLRSAGLHREARPDLVRAFVPPGLAMVDPFWIYDLLGLKLEPVGRAVLRTCHLVHYVPQDLDRTAIAATAAQVFPEPDPAGQALFISLDVEKKRWIEQCEAIALFVNTLTRCGRPPSRLIVNGMTAPWDGAPAGFLPDVQAEEARLLAEIQNRLDAQLPIETLFGLTFRDKIEPVRQCGFSLAPLGSAGLVPNALGIPGVLYSNRRVSRWGKGYLREGPHVARVPVALITDRRDAGGLMAHRWARHSKRVGYSIDPAAFTAVALRHYGAFHSLPAADDDAMPTRAARPAEAAETTWPASWLRHLDALRRRLGGIVG